MPLNDNVKGLSPNDPEPGINKSSTVNSLFPLDAEASPFFPVGTLNELNPDAKFFIPSNLTWNVTADNDSYPFPQSLDYLFTLGVYIR